MRRVVVALIPLLALAACACVHRQRQSAGADADAADVADGTGHSRR